MATATSEEDEEVATEEATPGVHLKKSSSRDYSRVMCETQTLTYVEDKSARNKIERQGSIRNGSTSARYVAASKRSYFGYHLWGCFPSRSRRSSLHLIPKLVLAPDGGAVSEIGRSMVKCGSSKGGPAFSRIPADAARGSYSEPTSPQVTCIGQVKSKSNNKNKPTRPVVSAHSNTNSNALLLRSRSSARRSISSPLASPARFARSNSSKRADRLVPCSTAPTTSPYLQEGSSSYEIDLTCNADDSNNNNNNSTNRDEEEAAALSSESQQEDNDMRVARRSSADQDGEDGSKAREVHRQLAIEVCQALAAASSAITPPYHHQQQEQEEEACTVALVDLTLKRLDSLRPSSVVDDPSPRACLWMRRSIARPIALDLTRKHRSKS